MRLTFTDLPPFGVLWVLSGCGPKQPPPPPPPAFTSQAWVADWMGPALTYTVSSVEGASFDPTQAETHAVIEQCSAVSLPTNPLIRWGTDPTPRVCWQETEGGSNRRMLFAIHPSGDLQLGVYTPEKQIQDYSPRLHLPTAFDIGDSWSARHTTPDGSELRRCDVSPTPWCINGAAISCVTLRTHQVTWVRNHWCPDSGHVGHEAMAASVGRPPLWSWSSDASRGETVLPNLPIEQRTFPNAQSAQALAATLSRKRIAELSPDDAQLPH